MPIKYVAEEKFKIGNEAVIEADSPQGSFVAVFEDDGSTGYFYAVDTASRDPVIQDAVHIYSIGGDVERGKEGVAKIGWTSDSQKAALVIDNHVHAVFGFVKKQGYCRTGYPAPPRNNIWLTRGHEWEDGALESFS